MASSNINSDGVEASSPLIRYESSPALPKTPTSSHSAAYGSTAGRQRGEFHSGGHRGVVPQNGLSSNLGGPDSDVEMSVVWGTTVDVHDCQVRFRAFFEEFRDVESGEPKYPILLQEVKLNESSNINLDCANLFEYDPHLYRQLILYPQEIIPTFDMVIAEKSDAMQQEDGSQMEEEDNARLIQVRTFNLQETMNMRDLDPSHVDQMISLRGMIIRVGQVLPDLRSALFRCRACSAESTIGVDRGHIQQPTRCPSCQSKDSLEIVHNQCSFADKQLLRVQEAPETIPDGETPQTVDVYTFDDLVDFAKPGDRVTITGIFRAVPARVSSRKRTFRAVYKTHIDTVHIRKADVGRLGVEGDPSDTGFDESDEVRAQTEERLAEFNQIASDPNIYERLASSIAPSIWGNEDIKKGVLCQLFGGSKKQFSASNKGRFRGDINILLCGDPGTSKSQILQYVHKIAPRGIFTSGKGSSAVGLTAYVTRDAETNEFIMESGALVLSDNGICCIDEFDKMSDTTRSILHEVMEQQTVSIAKAGIIATLNARTSILAAANPIHSRYNSRLSVVENIRLPPTLLSRFDLIYLVLDKVSESNDRRLAKHLVSMYFKEGLQPKSSSEYDQLPLSILTQYISYARSKISPILSDEAAEELQNSYVNMRRIGQTHNRSVITATPRQLESLIRLSEALAKMRLSSSVLRDDVIEATRLMDVSTGQSATDPVTGIVDIDMFTTGLTTTARKEISQQSQALSTLISELDSPTIRFMALHMRFNEQSSITVSHSDFWRVVNSLADAGVIRISQRSSGDNPEIRRL